MARVGKFVGRNSYKNVIDTSGSLAPASVSVTTVGVAVDSGSVSQTSNDIPIGAKLSAIFYTIYVYSDSTSSQDPHIDMYWYKRPPQLGTNPTPGNVGSSDLKRYVIHEEKGLAGNRTTGMPMIIKGVLRIPKALARFALGDELQFRILAPIPGFFCSKHIYRVIY